MSVEGEFKKRMNRIHTDVTTEPIEKYTMPFMFNDEIVKMLDEARKEFESYLGCSHYSSKGRFIRGIIDREGLVLCIEKWFGTAGK